MPNPLTLAFCLLLSLSSAALGAFVFHSEADALSASTDPATIERLTADLEHGAPIGLSTLSQAEALEFCAETMRSAKSLALLYLDEAQRLAIAPYCLRLSDAITARASTHSHAWAVGALAALRLADWPDFNRRFALSQSTGPSEGWIAAFRTGLALEAFAKLDDAAKAASGKDIAVMAASQSGARELARFYWQVPEHSSFIEDTVETLPGASQQRFIHALEQAG